ncbi:MAG: substrate-binding domain-containing protein [Segetibacter sp.]
MPQLSKYHTINIILPHNTYYPAEIITGLNNFCQQYAFNSKVVPCIKEEEIKKGEVYINVMEDDLVTLVEKILSEDLKIGHDVGVISYNETPLKKIILNGITTISTDFQMMGEKAAELVLRNSIEHIETKFYLTLRNSL